MKFDLSLNPPLMNAAGSLGFSPVSRQSGMTADLGAFVTNPVSLAPRSPAQNRGLHTFPGGFILHTGHPNPGLKAVIRRHLARWRRLKIPVIVHLLAQVDDEIALMVHMLENVGGVSAMEIGLPPEADKELTARLVRAAVGELPVLARLPLERLLELAEAAIGAGAAAVSLGPPRAALPGSDGRLLRGRAYGPALFPLALAAVQALAKSGLPVIGACGVYHPADVEAMLAAGALAVQLDSVLWRVQIPVIVP
jgi:dihydroorotate dehydrogenase (NAD+) catalytic subunit